MVVNPRNTALRVACAEHDISLAELARRAHLHPVTLYRVHAGRQKLCRATSSRVALILDSTPEQLGLGHQSGREE